MPPIDPEPPKWRTADQLLSLDQLWRHVCAGGHVWFADSQLPSKPDTIKGLMLSQLAQPCLLGQVYAAVLTDEWRAWKARHEVVTE